MENKSTNNSTNLIKISTLNDYQHPYHQGDKEGVIFTENFTKTEFLEEIEPYLSNTPNLKEIITNNIYLSPTGELFISNSNSLNNLTPILPTFFTKEEANEYSNPLTNPNTYDECRMVNTYFYSKTAYVAARNGLISTQAEWAELYSTIQKEINTPNHTAEIPSYDHYQTVQRYGQRGYDGWYQAVTYYKEPNGNFLPKSPLQDDRYWYFSYQEPLWKST